MVLFFSNLFYYYYYYFFFFLGGGGYLFLDWKNLILLTFVFFYVDSVFFFFFFCLVTLDLIILDQFYQFCSIIIGLLCFWGLLPPICHRGEGSHQFLRPRVAGAQALQICIPTQKFLNMVDLHGQMSVFWTLIFQFNSLDSVM